jgi:hypothetical protein
MAVNKVETVEIIRDLVTVLVTELTGSSAWVDNSDGTFTLPICRTYWLKAQDVITVDSVEYNVTDVTRDTSVTVTAASVPTELTFFLDAPSFYHGTIVQTNQELSQASKDVADRSPMAYLFRDLTDDFKDETDILDRESSIRLFFLHDTNFSDYTTDSADTETLEPMRSMAYFFVEEVLKASKLIGKIEDYSIRDYLKFGVENSSGYTENIFNDDFSGVELTITLPILKKYLCACDDVKPKIKYIDSDATLQSSNYGTLITCTPSGTVTLNVSNSDDSYDVDITSDLELPDINNIDSDGSTVVTPAQTVFTATPFKRSSETFRDGQTSSYTTGDESYLLGNGDDFYTLSEKNPFDNAFRFTDFSGNDWATGSPTGVHIIDWATADYVNETVVVWWQGYTATSVWATAMLTLTTDQGSSGYAS